MGRPTGRAWLDFGSTVPAASTLSLNTSNGRAQIRHRRSSGGMRRGVQDPPTGAFGWWNSRWGPIRRARLSSEHVGQPDLYPHPSAPTNRTPTGSEWTRWSGRTNTHPRSA